jgi:hypothetical protein
MQQLLAAAPRWHAFIILELDKPELCDVLQIIRGHPHLFLRHCALLVEIRLTLVDEEQRVRLSVVAWEVELLESGRTIEVVRFD